jgi:hypothetical protein
MALGRPPEAGTVRDVVVCVRFNETEIGYIDDVRGERTRSNFIRETLALQTPRTVESR